MTTKSERIRYSLDESEDMRRRAARLGPNVVVNEFITSAVKPCVYVVTLCDKGVINISTMYAFKTKSLAQEFAKLQTEAGKFASVSSLMVCDESDLASFYVREGKQRPID